jgi:hypothetical protein
MATKHANTLNNRLDYAGLQTALAGKTSLWGGFWLRFTDVTDGRADQSILTIRNTADSPSIQVFWDEAAPGSIDHSMCVYVRDSASAAVTKFTGDGGDVTAEEWHHFIFSVVLDTGADSAAVRLWKDGVEVGTASTGTYVDAGGGLDLTGTIIRVGGRASDKPLDGWLEGLFLCHTGTPTTQEIADLQTMLPHLALAESASTLYFCPDLAESTTYADRVNATAGVPSSVSPVRHFVSFLDYGRAPTIVNSGDPQYYGELPIGDEGQMYDDWADWLIAHKDALNIVGWVCPGDWCDDADEEAQYLAARAAVDLILAAGIWVYGSTGNHDTNASRQLDPPEGYMMTGTTLPQSLFSGQATFDAAMLTSGATYDSDYYTYSATIMDGWLLICLPWAPSTAQLDWAVAQAALHPTRKVWLQVHTFLNSRGGVGSGRAAYDSTFAGAGNGYGDYNVADRYMPNNYNVPGGSESPDPDGQYPTNGRSTAPLGSGWWYTHLAQIPNLAVISNGHDITEIATHKTAYNLLFGRYGNNVLAIYCNSQSVTDGGYGMCQLIEVDGSTLTCVSYRALLNSGEVWTGVSNSFAHTITESVSGEENPGAAAIAQAVREELAVELARLDASVSSRLAPSGLSYLAGLAEGINLTVLDEDTGLAATKAAVDEVGSVTDDLSPLLPGSGTLSVLDSDDLAGLASVSSGQPRINRKPAPAFTYQISRRADGTHKVTRPIRLTPGAVTNVYPYIDMAPLFGPDDNVDTVGTPTVSGGSITAAAEGPRDTGFYLDLGGTATASEARTITVPVQMESGTTVNVVMDVEVFGS